MDYEYCKTAVFKMMYGSKHLCHMCKDGKSIRVVSHTFMLNKHRVYCCPTCADDERVVIAHSREECGLRALTVEELKGLMPELEIKPSRHHVRVRLKDYIGSIKAMRVRGQSDSKLLDQLLSFVEKEAGLEDTLEVVCDYCGLELTYTLVVEEDKIHPMTEPCPCCMEST